MYSAINAGSHQLDSRVMRFTFCGPKIWNCLPSTCDANNNIIMMIVIRMLLIIIMVAFIINNPMNLICLNSFTMKSRSALMHLRKI